MELIENSGLILNIFHNKYNFYKKDVFESVFSDN